MGGLRRSSLSAAIDAFSVPYTLPPQKKSRRELPRPTTQDHAHIIPRPGGRRDCNQSSRAACRSIRAPWASGWRAGDAALSAQRRVPDGVRPRVTREVRSGCVAVSLAECLVLWFCVSLLCDRHRPSSVHPYRVGVPVVGRTVFRLPINQSTWCTVDTTKIMVWMLYVSSSVCACNTIISFAHPLAESNKPALRPCSARASLCARPERAPAPALWICRPASRGEAGCTCEDLSSVSTW